MIKDKHLRVIYESLYLRKKDLDFNSLKEFLNSRIKDKHLILLVDDVDELSEQNVKLIQMLVNNDLNLQLVLTSKKDLEIISLAKKDFPAWWIFYLNCGNLIRLLPRCR